MLQILLSTDANQVFKTNLGGQSVTILMRYQTVSESWFISIYNTVDNSAYVENKRLNPSVFIFGNIFTSFQGDIIALSNNTNENIGRNDFNDVYGLYYITEDEKTALREQ